MCDPNDTHYPCDGAGYHLDQLRSVARQRIDREARMTPLQRFVRRAIRFFWRKV